MPESKRKLPEAIAPETVESGLQRWFAWYDRRYDTYPLLSTLLLILLISFVLVILPLAILAYAKDIVGAFTDISERVSKIERLIQLIIIFIWMAFALFLTIVYHRQIRLVFTLVRFHWWCSYRGFSPIAKTVAGRSRLIIWSWTTYLEGIAKSSSKPHQASSVACDALVGSYLEGLTSIRTGRPLGDSKLYYTEPSHPLLPSNFLLYAYCVEQIRDATAIKYGPSSNVRIAIRTMLTGDITRWFNIQRLHLPGDKTLWCTTKWWERYKEQVRHTTLEKHGICLHRLLRFDSSQDKQTHDIQKRFFRLKLRSDISSDREFLSPSELVDAKKLLDIEGLSSDLTWLAGANYILEAKSDIPPIPIHPICLAQEAAIARINHWSNDRFTFVPAFQNYSEYHETFDPPPLKPNRPGAWGKQIDKDVVPKEETSFVRDYDDIFLVEFFNESEVLGRFGISYRNEEHKDIAGIRLLSNIDVEIAASQFDKVWKEATALTKAV